MLDFKEHEELSKDYDDFRNKFTDEDIEKAEYYDIEYDASTELTTVTIYDENESPIRMVTVEDYDHALMFVQEEFDVDEDELNSEYDYPTED